MMRRLQRLLPLLLAGVVGHAHAALDAGACKPLPGAFDTAAVRQAASRVAAARSQPGDQRLALADALADLALASVRHNGAAQAGIDGNPPAADLVRQSLAIWHAAAPDAALARTLQTRGVAFFGSRQCPLARDVLEAALRLSSAAAGADDPASVAIAHDLLRVALAQGDAPLVRRLAPAATKALDAPAQPLDAKGQQTLLALIDFLRDHAGNPQELQQAEQLAQRGLAQAAPGAETPARRALTYRLAGIYYAQLRYAEGEALRTQLAAGRPDPFLDQSAFARQREDLIALVRKGQLREALDLARALVERQRQALDASRQALTEAAAALAQAQAGTRQELAQAQRAGAQARGRQNEDAFHLALAQGYLGEIRHAMGDLDGAATAYETALAGLPDGSGARRDARVRTRSDLAILYRMRGDYARASPLQQQVLDELLPLLGEDHPDVREARAELALLHKLARP